MSPQPLTILSYGSKVTPGRVQWARQLVDDMLHCKSATCLEVTARLDDDGAAPGTTKAKSSR